MGSCYRAQTRCIDKLKVSLETWVYLSRTPMNQTLARVGGHHHQNTGSVQYQWHRFALGIDHKSVLSSEVMGLHYSGTVSD